MKIIQGALVVALAIVASYAPANADEKVGIILPLTGDFNYFGEETRQGMTLALEEFKAAGAAVPQFVYEDDKCVAKEAVTAYRRLTHDKEIALIIGPACSAAIKALSPIVRRSTIPVLFLLDTGSTVSSLPDPLFSFGFDPPKMARTLADDLYQRGLKKVALVTEDEEYAVLISNEFESHWKSRGGEIVTSVTHPLGEQDYRARILKVQQTAPEAIFFSSAYDSSTFLKQLRTVAPTIPVYGNDTMCTAATIDAAGATANGARCGNVILDENLPAVQQFRKALEKRFGKAPSSLFYSALGYDSVRLAFALLKRPAPAGTALLGIETRTQSGMYDITPSIMEIRDGKMLPVASSQ